MREFISSICGADIIVHELSQMIPCYNLNAKEDSINFIRNKFSNIKTNVNFRIRSVTKNTIAFFFEANNVDEIIFKNQENDKILPVKGIKKITIIENTGASAYHVPEGILYRFGSNIKKINNEFLDDNGRIETQNLKKLIEETIFS